MPDLFTELARFDERLAAEPEVDSDQGVLLDALGVR